MLGHMCQSPGWFVYPEWHEGQVPTAALFADVSYSWTAAPLPGPMIYCLALVTSVNVLEYLHQKGRARVQELSKEYIERQKEVDTVLLKALSPELKGYLGARFTLKAHDRPHLLKF